MIKYKFVPCKDPLFILTFAICFLHKIINYTSQEVVGIKLLESRGSESLRDVDDRKRGKRLPYIIHQ